MKIKKNDEVVVTTGKEKGKSGRVLMVDSKTNRLKISEINMIKKHVKPSQNNPEGGIQEKEGTIHISNVALKTKGKNGVATRVGYKIEDSKKIRYAKKTGKAV